MLNTVNTVFLLTCRVFIRLFDSYYHYHAFGEIKIYIPTELVMCLVVYCLLSLFMFCNYCQ